MLVGLPCAGVEATQRDPLLGFDPTAEKGAMAGDHGAASAADANMALDAAVKGSVGHRDGTVGDSSSMGAEMTDPRRGDGRTSSEGQLSGLSSTDAAKHGEGAAISETAVAATDSHTGAPLAWAADQHGGCPSRCRGHAPGEDMFVLSW